MKLRNAHLAVVERHKVVDYLLNAAHPDNRGKARFFESLGYTIEYPERLIAALRAVAQIGEVAEAAQSVHGEKHVVEGWLSAHTEESRQQAGIRALLREPAHAELSLAAFLRETDVALDDIYRKDHSWALPGLSAQRDAISLAVESPNHARIERGTAASRPGAIQRDTAAVRAGAGG